MRTLKYRAYIKPLKRYAEKYETILFHHQCNMEPSWTVNISPEEYYGDEDLVIEQFTGLLDRNGKEIYEGDIVYDIYTGDEIFIVSWDKDKASFMLADTADYPMAYFDEFEPGKDLEVIGNIHENPELLEGEE